MHRLNRCRLARAGFDEHDKSVQESGYEAFTGGIDTRGIGRLQRIFQRLEQWRIWPEPDSVDRQWRWR
jgi:hypothetical protein